MEIDKIKLRSILFRHLDGIAITPTINALHQKGICSYILNNTEFNFKDISKRYKTNDGYLNVALRLLSSQGWLKRNIIIDGEQINFLLTDKGRSMLSLSNHYATFSKFIPILINIDKYLYQTKYQSKYKDLSKLFDIFNSTKLNYKDTDLHTWEMIKHIEGVTLGPLLVSLGMSKFFTEHIESGKSISPEITNEFPLIKYIINLFTIMKWIQKDKFTEEGIFFMKRASAYGVTISYLPTFHNVSELLYGDPNILWKRTNDNLETHVNRRMNVWGSGGAHALYFKKIDEIITNLFNQPLDQQPLGIADMGCGDGTLLKHLYEIISTRTLRGKHLKEYPIKIIGADFNKAARIASNLTLKAASIPHSILAGDISDPQSYANQLKDKFDLDIRKMLNVRSFLDHNRIYTKPMNIRDDLTCKSTGAFSYRGRWIPNKELKQNLIEHFSAWKNHVSNFGLLILELHTINPSLASKHIGKTVATAYDGTHGYSDQYIFEIETMLAAANEAGLSADPYHQAQFPSKDFSTISINLFKSKS